MNFNHWLYFFNQLSIHLWLSPAPLSYCCYIRQTSSALCITYAVTAHPAEMLSNFYEAANKVSDRSGQKGLQYA